MPSKIHPNSRDLIGAGAPRRQFHVCKPTVSNADWLYDNLPSGTLFHTVNEAMAVAQDYDDVNVWPGEYTEDATIEITQDYLRLRAANFGPLHAKEGTALWQLGGTETPVITINAAHGVEVAGFGRIIPYNSTSGIGISIGATTECKGTWIHDNTFYAIETGTGPGHILMGASGVEAQYTLIENNFLYCGGDTGGPTGMIQWDHATRSTIRNNVFQVQSNSATMAGIYVVDRLYIRGQILDNQFWAMEQSVTSSAAYAVLTAGALVGGDFMIDGNTTTNFAAPFSDIGAEALGINYNGATAVSTG